jgi:peptidoglycan/LPS O-acetylase OafA/YrhL
MGIFILYLKMIKPLTSLRFVFAFMVYLHHLQLKSGNATVQMIYDFYFYEGHIGVSFFYILSGFILSYTYFIRFQEGKVSKKKFWVARFARVYPLHLVTLLIACIIALPHSWKIAFAQIAANLTLSQSFFPFPKIYFSLNGPSWSISDEAFFYLMFPFLILIKNVKVLIGLLFGLVILIVSYQVHIHQVVTFETFPYWFIKIFPFTRIADFIIGILLHRMFLLKKVESNLLEMGSVCLIILFFTFHSSVPIQYRLSSYYWLPMAFLVYAFSFQAGFLSKAISGSFFVLLGKISFAFYLIHQLVIRVYDSYNLNGNLLKTGCTLSASFLLAFILHKAVEEPMNKWLKNKLTNT